MPGALPDAGGRERRSVLRVYHSGVIPPWRRREQELSRLGWTVTLVTSRRWNEGGTDVAFEDGEADAIPVRTFGRHPALFVYDPVPIARLMRAREFDVLDFHEEPFSLAAVELALLRWSFARGRPMLLYTAQNIAKRYPIPFRWTEAWLLRAAAAIYACSSGAAAVVRAKGATGIVEDLPLGVDLDAFHPAAEPTASGCDLRVAYVGRLLPEKGVATLVRAVAATPGVTVDLVGEGPERALLLELAEKAPAGTVRLRGFVPHAELPALYREFDAVVVPSLPTPSWTEQFCRVAVEAMACGVPVVVSDSGALPGVVGDAGLVVPAGDEAALSTALARLRDDPGLRADLRARGLARATRYAWPEVAQRHAWLYDEVLRGR